MYVTTAQRSITYFSVLIAIVIATALFVLKKANDAIAEIDRLGQTYALQSRELNKQETSSLPAGVDRSQADMDEWKTYRNEQYGFEVRYPSNWFLTDDSRGIGITPLTPEDPLRRSSIGLGSEFLISVEAGTVEKAVAQYTASENFARKEIVLANSVPAALVTYTGVYGGETHFSVLIPRGGFVIGIHYIDADKYQETFEEITQTFEFF